jgi:predicted permease
MAEQMQLHLELMIEENMANGMTSEEARQAAVKKFGGIEQLKEQCRDERSVKWIEDFLGDVRYGLRMLRKSPGFSLVVILSMALGIGVNSAVFSQINDQLLRMLPVKAPSELVLFQWLPGSQGGRPPSDGGDLGEDNVDLATGLSMRRIFSLSCFEAFQRSPGAVSDVIGCAGIWGLNARIDGKVERVGLAVVASGNFYQALGVQVRFGRGFRPEDDRPGAPAVAVISYRYWQSRFAGSPAVIGKTVFLNQVPLEIIGVTEPEFQDPVSGPHGAEYTLPLSSAASIRSDGKDLANTNHWWIRIIGRLKPGATLEQARAGFEGVFEASAHESIHDPKNLPRLRVVAGGYGTTEAERHRQSSLLKIEAAITVLVLGAACVNVANLLLARGTGRRREIAIRIALGASRSRVVRQLLTESLLLSLLGSGVSLAFAFWGFDLLSIVLPYGAVPRLDLRVVVVNLALALVGGFAFGLAPALRATRLDLTAEFQGGAGRFGSSRSRLSQALLVAQIAISFIVVAGAGLAVQTVYNLRSVDVGFNRTNLLVFPIDAGLAGFNGPQAVALDERIKAKVAELGGVTSVTYAGWPHLIGISGFLNSFSVPGNTPTGKTNVAAAWNPVAPDFFQVCEISFYSGRNFSERDGAGTPQVAVINRTMARLLFGDANPVGKRFGRGKSEREIVGVVGDVRNRDLRSAPAPTFYTPFAQGAMGSAFFIARTSGDPHAVIPSIQGAVQAVEPNLPVPQPYVQDDLINSNVLGTETLLERMSVALGSLVLGLACIGLYGLLSYAVFARTREIGIRIALGALPGRIHWTMLRESASVVGLGTLIGIGGSVVVLHSVSRLFYGVPFFDPATYAGVALLLFVIAALASWLPARRAARVDPMVALRAE